MASSRCLGAATCSSWLLFFALFAGCGGGGSDGGGGSVAPAPTANAGMDETAAVGVPITLDGSASDSPTGTPVSYQWTLSQKPAGSTASLTSPTSVRPTFTPDVAGSYTATLVVQASGMPSAPDSVAITAVTGNVAPRADAGPDRSAAPGRSITLDGTASRDPNSTTVTYSWRIVEQPPGSHPTLTNATSAKPTFTADVAGRYVLTLVCSDGSLTSTVDQVVIIVATGNLPPVANAGPDQTVTAGQLVTLDGTGSTDPNGDPLTYSWCLRGRPQGSNATLNGANTARPTFTPDVAGSYVLCLTVNDGQAGSASDSVVVEARLPSSVNGVLQAYIKASNTTENFGGFVVLDDDTLAVNAADASCATGVNGNQTNTGCPGAGAVYVFTRTGDTWSQQAYLKASNTEAHDGFGAMSLSGDTLAIGASGEDSCATGVNGNQADNGCVEAGAVYVFTRTGDTWSQQAYLKASNPDTVPRFFGQAVAVSGDTLVVGAPGERSCALGINGNQMDTGCDNNGAVYIFTRSNNVWTQEAYVKPSSHARERLSGIGFNAVGFGFSVALDGNTLAVGAVYEDGCSSGINGDQTNNGCAATGAVYVFTRTDAVWAQQAYVKPSNTDTSANATGYQFGLRLALHGDNLVVGAPLEPSCATGINGNQLDKGCPSAGAVYIFTRTNNVWSQVAYVKPTYPDLQSFIGRFGNSLAFDGTTLAVSAGDNNCAKGFNPSPLSSDCTASGAVYLFTRTATTWAQRAYVKAPNTDAYDFFGTGLAVAGNTLVVGAPTEDSCATGINGDQNDNRCTGTFREEAPNIGGAGAVYVYALE